MRLEDVEQVYAIDVLSFSMPWTERSYRFELTENPAAGMWVAEMIGEQNTPHLVGIIATWFIIDEVHIALLHSAYKGANTAMLEVRRTNLAAQALYDRFGFKEVGVRVQYYSDNNEDALLMNLEPIDVEFIRGLEKM
jgi:ribosomal-protein-alanine N-acetyltransferase